MPSVSFGSSYYGSSDISTVGVAGAPNIISIIPKNEITRVMIWKLCIASLRMQTLRRTVNMGIVEETKLATTNGKYFTDWRRAYDDTTNNRVLIKILGRCSFLTYPITLDFISEFKYKRKTIEAPKDLIV